MPPLRAVRYFESAAEQESFARAAEALRVSKGAVSQQVKILESYLGVALFRRNGRRLTLTDAGRRYHSAIRNAFNLLEEETERLAGARLKPTIKLSVLPAFAAIWLVPRLAEFQGAMPHIDIEISAEAEVVDFSKSDAHLGIRYGVPDSQGLVVTRLGRDELFPVCAPSYLRDNDLRTPESLAHCRLLHDTYWSDDWPRWLRAAGVSTSLGGDGRYFTHYSMAIDTARAGGGVAMGHSLLLRDLLERGELTRPLDLQIGALGDYVVVVPEHAAHLDYVKRFRDWLHASFAQ